jgi:hypothetical protein
MDALQQIRDESGAHNYAKLKRKYKALREVSLVNINLSSFIIGVPLGVGELGRRPT